MSSKTSNALFFIITAMFVFVNTSQAKFMLIELDGEYENEDVSPITRRPMPPLKTIPALMETTVAETNSDEFSKPERSDEAPVSIEKIENNEVNIDDDDSPKNRVPGYDSYYNTKRDSTGQRSLQNKAGKLIIFSFVQLF